MIFQSSKGRGFTVIELVVVIVVIAVLSTVATVSYRGVQRDARDSERETDIQIIVASLERFYDENGHYPGGSTVSGSSTNSFFQNTLGVPVQAITPPQSSNANIVYISTTDTPANAHRIDRYAYTPQTATTTTCSGANCAKYRLRYKMESVDGTAGNITVNSRYGW